LSKSWSKSGPALLYYDSLISLASVSRRSDSARQRSATNPELAKAYNRIIKQYNKDAKES